MADTSIELLRRLSDGDASAADVVYHRYADRLIRLAQRRLSPRLARRVAAEDIVQSAYRSFFCGVASHRAVAQRRGGLWRLLAQITINKLLSQVERHQAERRDMRREAVSGQMAAELQMADAGPAPDEIVALVEEATRIVELLDARPRRAVEMRLEDCSLEEIARELDCTERTVRRWLAHAGELLAQRQRELQMP